MQQWREVAIALKDSNERYQSILGLKTDPPILMASGRIVSDSQGPLRQLPPGQCRQRGGHQAGNPVMSENGLVGRVVGVTNGVSRVLLLTDVASRTPVMIDRTNARAILTGDGGPNPKLEYLRGLDPVKNGDRVLTSGDGGVFPRGLPVGVAVKGLDGKWRVVLASDKASVDFVRILLFQDFTQLANRAAPRKGRCPAARRPAPRPCRRRNRPRRPPPPRPPFRRPQPYPPTPRLGRSRRPPPRSPRLRRPRRPRPPPPNLRRSLRQRSRHHQAAGHQGRRADKTGRQARRQAGRQGPAVRARREPERGGRR
jgi:rod shape-determining protein MreC